MTFEQMHICTLVSFTCVLPEQNEASKQSFIEHSEPDKSRKPGRSQITLLTEREKHQKSTLKKYKKLHKALYSIQWR